MRVASAVPLTTEDNSNAPSRMHLIDKTAPAIEAMSKAFEDLHRSAGLRRRREGSRDHCHHCGNRANIIPNQVVMGGTLRTMSEDRRQYAATDARIGGVDSTGHGKGFILHLTRDVAHAAPNHSPLWKVDEAGMSVSARPTHRS